MMDTIARTTKGKKVAENPILQEGHARQNSKEDPLHSPRFTHHHAQTSQWAYMSEMPPVDGYPHTHMHHLVGQLPNNEPVLEANPTSPVLMSKLNDPKRKEKVNESAPEQTSNVEIQRRYSLLDERLKVLEGDDIYGVIDAIGLSLVLDLIIPSKFKVPIFAKYGGTSCPKKHLTMYCKKMAGYIGNEKLPIHCF